VASYLEKIQRLCRETTGVEWSDLGLAGKASLLKDDLVKIVYERFVKQPDSPDIPDKDYATEWNGPAGLDKAERMCWARGNWVSFMANMIRQTSYLGQLQYIWEGRNEEQIGQVKEVMVSMRRTQSFRETKMRLLHKLAGVEWLSVLFADDEHNVREWFKGSFRFESWKDILARYASGQPLSCAASTENDRHFHICYYAGDYELINYVTVEAFPAANFVEVMGVIFCRFEFVRDEEGQVKVDTVSKKDFKHRVSSHALMLSYKMSNGDHPRGGQSSFKVATLWH